MKKLILTSIVALAASLSLQAQPVYSNIVGMYKVTKVAGGLQLLGVNIGNDSTLSSLVNISQFTGDALTGGADKVITFDSSTQTYTTYAIYDDTSYGGTTVAWRLASDFYGDDVDPVLPAGSAVFVQAVDGDNVELVVSGNVSSEATSTLNIVAGLQMAAIPFTAKIDINDVKAGFISSGATGDALTGGADRIITWDEQSQGYITYALYDDTSYGGSTTEWRLASDFYNSPATPIELNLGAGFWYDAKNAFTWVATSPYAENL